jgi:hypothetical protein
MFAGSVRLALGLIAALPVVAAAQGFEYAPGTAKYRVIQTTKARQDIMGEKQEIESQSSQVMTVTLNRAAKDTVAMQVVLDSISSTNSVGMPTQMTDRFVGMKVAAKISPSGAFYSAQGPGEVAMPNSTSMADAMGNFLPKLRGTLAKGANWTDTTSGTVKQGGMDIERKTVSKYSVQGDTTVGTEKSWIVVRVDSTTLTGSGNSPSGPMTMEGTTNGVGSIFVTPKGLLLGVNATEEAVLKIVLASNGMEIGVTQSATTKVEKIR